MGGQRGTAEPKPGARPSWGARARQLSQRQALDLGGNRSSSPRPSMRKQKGVRIRESPSQVGYLSSRLGIFFLLKPGKNMGCSPLWLEYGCSTAALCFCTRVLRAQRVDQFKAIFLPPSVKTTSTDCAPSRVTGPHWGRPVAPSLPRVTSGPILVLGPV